MKREQSSPDKPQEKSPRAQMKARINRYSMVRALKYFRKYCREIGYEEFAEIFECQTLYRMVVDHKQEEKSIAAGRLSQKTAARDHIICKGVIVQPVNTTVTWNFDPGGYEKTLECSVRNRLLPNGTVSPAESVVFEVRAPRLGKLSIVPQSDNCFRIIIE